MLSKSLLENVLSYDPGTGVFKWKVSKSRRAIAGGLAGSIVDSGYRKIKVDGKHYFAHRLAFILMGHDLPEQVDHINGIRSDNRWENLRPATSQINSRNRCLSKNNTSGFGGVGWHKKTGRWVSRISVGGKEIHLGYYDEISDALEAREAAEMKYGFHPNHGRQKSIAPESMESAAKADPATAVIRLRITPQDKARWQAIAEALGIPLSEYIRQCVEDAQG